jgi:transposase
MHKRVIGLDVHQAKITACAVVEHDEGRVEVTKQDFGAFKRDRRALAQWALAIRPEVVVMESTGVYWKSPFAALEAVGIIAWVVNARHVKAVPGRKTDMADAQWLATLARAGLLRASFIPPLLMRQLRLVARQRQKLVGMCSAEKNRLLKVLVDAGIRINVVVADIHGASARAMVKALIADKPMHEVLDCKGRLPCEFAQAAARTRCALKAKFDSLAIRKGHKKSVVALGHKMLRTIYAMLSTGSHYQDKTVDYEAMSVARNAPRWLKMLRKHGFIAAPAAA